MLGVDRECPLVGLERRVEVLQVAVAEADQVPCIGILGIRIHHDGEQCERLLVFLLLDRLPGLLELAGLGAIAVAGHRQHRAGSEQEHGGERDHT